MLFCQLEQQRLLWCEIGHGQRFGLFQPTISVRFAAIITFDLEMLAEHSQLPLDGAQIAVDAGILQLLVQLAGRDLAAARNAAQQFDGQQDGFQGV